jgi:hypothetical protein
MIVIEASAGAVAPKIPIHSVVGAFSLIAVVLARITGHSKREEENGFASLGSLSRVSWISHVVILFWSSIAYTRNRLQFTKSPHISRDARNIRIL